jgi:hypothetical protein
MPRVINRRSKQLGKSQLAEFLTERDPARDSPWHCDCLPTFERNMGEPGIVASPQSQWGPAARIQTMKLFPIPNDGEHVTTYTIAHRFHDGKSDCRSYGCIDRVAASAHGIQPGLRRKSLTRCDDVLSV